LRVDRSGVGRSFNLATPLARSDMDRIRVMKVADVIAAK